LLIILYWKDAWAGTILNVLILPAVIVSFANWGFHNSVSQEVQALFASAAPDNKIVVTKEMLERLPHPVQSWLEHSGLIGKERIQTVRLKQKGMMRSKPEDSWMSADAKQYFTVDRPAFVWEARIQPMPLVHIAARDRFDDGKGNMLIKALSLVTIADAKGAEIDQGTMVRYLAETVWFPSAALSDYFKWEAIDSTSARAIMSCGGLTVSGVFRFNAAGDVTNFEAQRYGEFDGKYLLETWSIAMSGHKSFNGIRIPAQSEVTWKLKNGDFTWLKLEITELEFNKEAIFVR
jgi:hypothetical protein